MNIFLALLLSTVSCGQNFHLSKEGLTQSETNAPPTAVADGPVLGGSFGSAIVVDVDGNDTAGSGVLDPSSITITSNANAGTEGTCTVGGAPGYDVTFTPVANFTGTASCTYEICDSNSLCDTAVITFDPHDGSSPVAVADSGSTAPNTPVTVDVFANDTDADGNLSQITISITTNANPTTEGTCTVTNAPLKDITFTPVPAFTGTAVCTYEVCDLNSPTAQCDTADVSVDVIGTPTVTISAPSVSSITTGNESAYTLSGTCTENGEDVIVKVAGIAMTPNPVCSGHAWSIVVGDAYDVSSVPDGSVLITADHSTAVQATNNTIAKTTLTSGGCRSKTIDFSYCGSDDRASPLADSCSASDISAESNCTVWSGGTTFTQSCFGSGQFGSKSAPYKICTVKQLQEAALKLDAHYELGRDIDMSDSSAWAFSGNDDFMPIGNCYSGSSSVACQSSTLSSDTPFVGALNGRGHKIYNFNVNRAPTGADGIIGRMGNGAVCNLRVDESHVEFDSTVRVTGVGLMVGKMDVCSSATSPALVRYLSIEDSMNTTYVDSKYNAILSAATGLALGDVGINGYYDHIDVKGTLKVSGGYNGGIIGSAAMLTPLVFEFNNLSFDGMMEKYGNYTSNTAFGGVLGRLYSNGNQIPAYSLHSNFNFTLKKIAPADPTPSATTIGGLVGTATKVTLGEQGNASKISSATVDISKGTDGGANGNMGGAFGSALTVDVFHMNIDGTTNAELGGSSQSGAFAGTVGGGLVGARRLLENVTTNVNHTCGGRCGGLIGTLSGYYDISDSYVLGNVTSVTTSYVSGFVGNIGTGVININHSGVEGNVSGVAGNGFAGFIGAYFGTVTGVLSIADSYAWGSVTGTTGSYSGGFVGFISSGELVIDRSYATGPILNTSGARIGGFVGGADGSSVILEINDSFTIADVTTNTATLYGGFIGGVEGGASVTLNNNFFAADIIKASSAPFTAADCGAGFNNISECDYTSKASLQGNNTQAVFNLWDFGSIWQVILGDYPDLQ